MSDSFDAESDTITGPILDVATAQGVFTPSLGHAGIRAVFVGRIKGWPLTRNKAIDFSDS